MNHWLLKTEPTTFGVDHLEAAARKTTGWDGVRNYQARNYIRDQMKKGDEGFLYHSSCAIPGVVAIVTVVKAPYPDETAFKRGDPHFDPDSDPAAPRWYSMDIKLTRRLKRVITLEELKAHAKKQLSGMILLRPGNRLSVSPVEDAHWRFVLSLE
ncbi:MAG TPA: EVE domain-containing protein [Steroidobacteraceae bacterium]|nr:EVE domain-containing protein [Steroidobacteraceae bacterium]